MVAHSLAAFATTCNSAGFWLGYIPDLSEPLFGEDSNNYVLK
jgi:hypothetical protein